MCPFSRSKEQQSHTEMSVLIAGSTAGDPTRPLALPSPPTCTHTHSPGPLSHYILFLYSASSLIGWTWLSLRILSFSCLSWNIVSSRFSPLASFPSPNLYSITFLLRLLGPSYLHSQSLDLPSLPALKFSSYMSAAHDAYYLLCKLLLLCLPSPVTAHKGMDPYSRLLLHPNMPAIQCLPHNRYSIFLN